MPTIPTKADLKPQRHHGYSVFLFILGTLFPPLAVAARFGFGGDFWLNLLLTICGYIPGHGHNFYIQNIRNNKNHARTPKWAQRYGLVDTTKIQRNKKKSQWASRYNDRLPHSTLESQPYEEGQEPRSSTDVSSEGHVQRSNTNGELWRPEDESYYGERRGDAASARSEGSSGGRWHYPANFDDTLPTGGGSKKKKKEKKDRWARTEDAYSITEEGGTKKKKKKRSKSAGRDADTYSQNDPSTSEFPEDAEGGLYGDSARGRQSVAQANGQTATQGGDDMFRHEF